jgi:TRAP-type C4-dicarboxylate transport system substrate-binding protein
MPRGLFVHLINKRWLDKLPEDLRLFFSRLSLEESAATRELTRKQHDTQVAAAKESGVEFLESARSDLAS